MEGLVFWVSLYIVGQFPIWSRSDSAWSKRFLCVTDRRGRHDSSELSAIELCFCWLCQQLLSFEEASPYYCYFVCWASISRCTFVSQDAVTSSTLNLRCCNVNSARLIPSSTIDHQSLFFISCMWRMFAMITKLGVVTVVLPSPSSFKKIIEFIVVL